MLTAAQIEQFQADGFLNGGQVLNNDEVEKLRTEVMRVIDERERDDIPQPVHVRNMSRDDGRAVWQIVNIWEASGPFRKLISREDITTGIAQLTGASELRIWHDQIQYKPPQTGGTTHWHQDAPLWPIIRPMTEVTAWVALVPTEYEGRPLRVASCPVKKGEVHFHHALTWHGSHDNDSDRPRRAIALHYMTNETFYVASGEHVMKAFVEVQDGEQLRGKHFPQVYPNG